MIVKDTTVNIWFCKKKSVKTNVQKYDNLYVVF